MTALQFMTQFRHTSVLVVGRNGDLSWAMIVADTDGTEPQCFFVMEHRDGQVRTIQNLRALEQQQAMADPLSFWTHERAEWAE